MNRLRHFSELSRDEVIEMWNRCVDAAIEYAKEVDMSGLSDGDRHNIYNALETAIIGEWERSKNHKPRITE